MSLSSSVFCSILAHGVCQFHQLSSKSTDLRGRRITVIKRALVLPPAAGSVPSLCRFLVEIRTLKAERLARVRERRSKGGKYAAFARRFGEFKDDEQSVHSDEADDLEVGSPPRVRRAAKGPSSRARREAEAAAAEADLEEDLHERFRERFSIRR